ncbi:MAG: hypothetical protein IJF92_04105 [Bacilli bacterium]|nr:hypothetical protein [Bacilli bacterium]
MVEESLIKHFSNKKLEWVKIYLLLISYEALRADLFLDNNFKEEEVLLIKEEVNRSRSIEELFKKLERIKIQNNKIKKDNLNSKLPIEEFGPFTKEVENILRENVIDNMDDLLNTDLKYDIMTTTAAKEDIEFMKKWYDFSDHEDKVKQLTKTNKNSKI